jgi:hypothetical protein
MCDMDAEVFFFLCMLRDLRYMNSVLWYNIVTKLHF